jgi:hypothetical protein
MAREQKQGSLGLGAKAREQRQGSKKEMELRPGYPRELAQAKEGAKARDKR